MNWLNRRFGGTCCLHQQDSLETPGSSDTLVRTYQTAWRHIAADRGLKKNASLA